MIYDPSTQCGLHFSEEEIALVIEKNQVLGYLENKGYSFRRVGSEYRTLCMLHDEKTPSFFVNIVKNRWYCYGCQNGGNIIHWVQKSLNCSFPEAMRMLGGQAASKTNGEALKGQLERQREERKCAEKKALRARMGQKALPVILREFHWEFADVFDSSPIRLDEGIGNEASTFIEAMFFEFGEEFAVWIGTLYSSAKLDATETEKYHYQNHFRTVNHWLKGPIPYPRVAPGLFQIGETGRRKENVVRSPYIVVECDELVPEKTGNYRRPENPEEKTQNLIGNLAVTNWLRQHLELSAIVFTGNKSAHAWFRRPSDTVVADLSDYARSLKIDQVFKEPSSPFRIPGFYHEKTGKLARLLWLKGGLV